MKSLNPVGFLTIFLKMRHEDQILQICYNNLLIALEGCQPVRVLFSPMVSRWMGRQLEKFVRAVSQKP